MSKDLVAVSDRKDLDPATLDRPIKRSAVAMDSLVDAWETLAPLVKTWMAGVKAELEEIESQVAEGHEVAYLTKEGKPTTRDHWLRGVGMDLVTYTEKLTRALAAMTKTVDEAARLRHFLLGGDDERPDLQGASDVEMIESVIQVVIVRNLLPEIQKRLEASRGGS